MDDLTGEFIAETRETLERIGDALIAWEADPQARERLDEIFRFVHTVKGSCGFLDLTRIEALAHAAETVLGALRSGARTADSRLVSAMLAIIDRIALLTDCLETDAEFPAPEGDAALIAALDGAAEAPPPIVEEAPDIAPRGTRNVRIAVDLLDAMMSQVSDLVLVRNELARALRTARGDSEAEATLDRLSVRVGDLRDSVARARLLPVERLFAALPRLVRDTAADLGKSVRLVVEGGDVELDREMVEQLRDPLIHMVRNAIDHGVETPEARVAKGKLAQATLRVSARQSGNQVAIDVIDDGRGIDTDRLRARAVEAGIVDARRAADMSGEEATALVFEAGLSTASAVTAISGRGVGMDVVRANVEKLGGSIALDSKPGQGLAVEICVPLTLSIITVLTVTAGGQRFAIPHAAIDEVFSVKSEAVRLEELGSGRVVTVRGETLSVVTLGTVLALDTAEPEHLVVIEAANGFRWALAIDAVCDHEEVVVRPVAPIVAAGSVFAGQTLPDTGTPLLLIDVFGLTRRARVDVGTRAVQAVAAEVATPTRALVTFTALDGRHACVDAHLLDRIEDIDVAAFMIERARSVVTLDGAVHAVTLVGALPDTGCVTILRIGDGERLVAYPVAQVHDLVRVPMSDFSPSLLGTVALIDGVPTPMLDGFALFADEATATATQRPLAAVVAGESFWARTILAPLVEAAGYRVVFGAGASDEPPAIAICLDDTPDILPEGARIIRLHSRGDAAEPGTIDRYDRRAIEAALAAPARSVAR